MFTSIFCKDVFLFFLYLSEPASLGDSAGLRRMFGSLSYSMFTLFQFMTFDSWAVVARQRPKKLELMADFATHGEFMDFMGYFTGKHSKKWDIWYLDLFEHV